MDAPRVGAEGTGADGHALARLFDPRGVAVLGASQAPGKYGTILLQTLVEERLEEDVSVLARRLRRAHDRNASRFEEALERMRH